MASRSFPPYSVGGALVAIRFHSATRRSAISVSARRANFASARASRVHFDVRRYHASIARLPDDPRKVQRIGRDARDHQLCATTWSA
jgi:hypothetical protein